VFLQEISLNNFRNYHQVSTKAGPFLNIIIGDNAQGKTNLLEAIYLAAVGKSHRTHRDQELIKWAESFFRIILKVNKGNSLLTLEIIYSLEKRKQYKLNGVPKNKLVDLLGNFNAVLFAPEHLMLVKGSPHERRQFLDSEISQTNTVYFCNLQQYLRVLQQRNNFLKSIKGSDLKPEMLDIWNIQLVELGTKIIMKRLEVLKKLNPLARLVHRKITVGQENLEINYFSSLGEIGSLSSEKISQHFMELLQQNFKQEARRGYTIVGPHRDDLIFKVNEYDVRLYGSQGQQRTTVLALKLAELEFIKAETGQYPVLLLDDVMSELDYSRRKFLLETIQDKIQTFVTATGIDSFPEKVIEKAFIYKISKGQICSGTQTTK
jgi:DNA replication and repair protein RecF